MSTTSESASRPPQPPPAPTFHVERCYHWPPDSDGSFVPMGRSLPLVPRGLSVSSDSSLPQEECPLCKGAGFVVVPDELEDEVGPRQAREHAVRGRGQERGPDRGDGGRRPHDPAELSDAEQLELARKALAQAQQEARAAKWKADVVKPRQAARRPSRSPRGRRGRR